MAIILNGTTDIFKVNVNGVTIPTVRDATHNKILMLRPYVVYTATAPGSGADVGHWTWKVCSGDFYHDIVLQDNRKIFDVRVDIPSQTTLTRVDLSIAGISSYWYNFVRASDGYSYSNGYSTTQTTTCSNINFAGGVFAISIDTTIPNCEFWLKVLYYFSDYSVPLYILDHWN